MFIQIEALPPLIEFSNLNNTVTQFVFSLLAVVLALKKRGERDRWMKNHSDEWGCFETKLCKLVHQSRI